MQHLWGERRRLRLPPQQQGAALLMLLLIILLSAAYTVMGTFSATTLKIERQNKTTEALAQAKEALIAWSVLQGDVGKYTNSRPGNLPCPDTTNSGIQNSTCVSTSGAINGKTIGRLPWRTLKIEDLCDAAGERLWYALSDKFRNTELNPNAINSDTLGSLKLYASDGKTLLTLAGEELVAVIFSAGSPLAGQNREADQNNVANYLDTANNQNNANASGPFITGPIQNSQGDTILNDHLITISAAELIGAIEKRALKEAQNALAAFALDNGGKYPNPAKRNDTVCISTITNITNPSICPSASNQCFGRLPEDSVEHYAASWFKQNGWGRTMTYAVNKNDVVDGSASSCSTLLKVNGQIKSYVIVAPGSTKSGRIRPSSTLVNYLEDAENQDAWTTGAAQRNFIKPKNTSNDQLRSVP